MSGGWTMRGDDATMTAINPDDVRELAAAILSDDSHDIALVLVRLARDLNRDEMRRVTAAAEMQARMWRAERNG